MISFAARAIVLLVIFASAGLSETFQWERFEVAGHKAFVILPPNDVRQEPLPWILYAPTFDKQLPNERDEGWMIERFQKAGIAVAGVDVGESYGSPAGRKVYDALYAHLTQGQHKCASKVALLARSRGGLMLYNWAAENPAKVACIAGIYPVCDLRSYPGLRKAHAAYALSEEQLTRNLAMHNPVDRLTFLARQNVPIFHIHGDQDNVVPLEANSATIAERYQKLGGTMELKIAKGQGHNMWPGFFQCQELVDFVVAHTPQGKQK